MSRRELWAKAGDLPKGVPFDSVVETTISRLQKTIARNQHCSITFIQPDAHAPDPPKVVGTM